MAASVPDLPEDILHLICDELLHQNNFGTLFQCAIASRVLAVPALQCLYRSQHMSTVKADSNEEALTQQEQQTVVMKWSILWRSIILSALGETIMPYCRYIRVLNLDDLRLLFEDNQFRDKVSRNFFSKQLSRFNIPLDTPTKHKGRGPRLNISAIIDAIGDLLTVESPLLEEVTGPINGPALARWIPRLPNMHSLQVWDGKALGDELVPHLLRVHCPKLSILAMFMWVDSDQAPGECDQKLAAVFSTLPEHSLKSFSGFSRINFRAETLLALNRHGMSLTHLEVQFDKDAIPYMGFLKGCTALESIRLTDSDKTVDLEKEQHDVFLEVVAWLTECRKLHKLDFDGFISGAAIATPVLLTQGIHLEDLSIYNYAVNNHDTLHKALAHQPSLQTLVLNSEQIEFRDGLDTLLHSLCQLKKLRTLKLINISAMCNDQFISALAENLEYLEDLYVGGLLLTDICLESIVHLRHLRSIAFSGITTFTWDGLSNLVTRLGPGNKGLVLAIDNADADSGLSADEQQDLRRQLADTLDGRFEYTFLRDPDVSEFDTESD